MQNLFKISNEKKQISFWLFHFTKRKCSSSNNPVHLSFIKANNSKIDTTKNPLLVFHGLFGNKNNWKSLINHISNRTNKLVYSFDLRNHGESPHVDGYESDMNAMASDIKFFMENNNIEKADLLGHSLGGRICSQFAFNWPDKLDKLILVDIGPLPTLPKIDFLTKGFFDMLDDCVRNLPDNINLSQARIIVKNALVKAMQNVFIADFFLLNLYHDAKTNKIKWRFNTMALKILIETRLATELSCNNRPFNGPSMIIYGEKSDYVKSEQENEIKKLMPNVQLISIADTGHYLHVEKPNQFLDYVVQFLK